MISSKQAPIISNESHKPGANRSEKYQDLHMDRAGCTVKAIMDSTENESLGQTNNDPNEIYSHMVTPQRLLTASNNTFDRFMKSKCRGRSMYVTRLPWLLEVFPHTIDSEQLIGPPMKESFRES